MCVALLQLRSVLGLTLTLCQVEVALAALRAEACEEPLEVLEALEAVARLSWSDDEVPPDMP